MNTSSANHMTAYTHRKSSAYLTVLLLIMSLMLVLSSCGKPLNTADDSQANAGSSDNKYAVGTTDSYEHLEPEDAAEMIDSGLCILVDCRGEPEFDYERIPGSINVPIYSEDADIEKALPDKEAVYLVYCDYGGISKQFADHLTFDLGYSNIYEFDGILVWEGDLEGSAHE